jgi:hypothetical protein
MCLRCRLRRPHEHPDLYVHDAAMAMEAFFIASCGGRPQLMRTSAAGRRLGILLLQRLVRGELQRTNQWPGTLLLAAYIRQLHI